MKKQVHYYKEMEEDSRYLTAWTLDQDLLAGDAVTEADLKEINIRVRKEDDLAGIQDADEIIGRRVKTGLKKGTLLQPEMIYEGEADQDDQRMKEVSGIQLPDQLAENDYIDIRAGFPDGEDYIVVRHKKVLGFLMDEEEQVRTGIRLDLSEEELLRLSSAQVDTAAYANTKLYAIKYKEDFQQAAVATYPMNQKTYDLLQWDPNAVSKEEHSGEERRRRILEQNLKPYQRQIGQALANTDTGADRKDTAEQGGKTDLELFE